MDDPLRNKVYRVSLLALVIMLLQGCGSGGPEIINFSNIYGDFILSAPATYRYLEDGESNREIFIIGSEDENCLVMVMQYQRAENSQFWDIESFAAYYEEISFNDGGVEITGEAASDTAFAPAGAVAGLMKTFPVRIDRSHGSVIIGYAEYENKFYVIQVYWMGGKAIPQYILDIPGSFNEKNAPYIAPPAPVDEGPEEETAGVFTERHAYGGYTFNYNETWQRHTDSEGISLLVSPDGLGTVVPVTQEEETLFINLEDYVDIVKWDLAAHYEGYAVIAEEYREINGYQACVLLLAADEEETQAFIRHMIILEGGWVYVLNFNAPKSSYETYLPDVLAMEDSFTIMQ